ncbi:MAG: riboflavin synthase [Proteobacteria bacterium]|nr:riboflavin synthase [Pseudomonadota bacterium]
MFTGIVLDVGTVENCEKRGGDLRLTIACHRLDLSVLKAGDSVSVQGCCLTAVEINAQRFVADVSRETLSVTTLGELVVGAAVNLEPALRAGDALGGHLVSGHVDAVGSLVTMSEDARSRRLGFALPASLARFVAPKGSITVDGVSLTVNTVSAGGFDVNIIPHTLTHTTLGALTVDARVNLEIDLVARYLDRLVSRE